jgi:hypothetical protein
VAQEERDNHPTAGIVSLAGGPRIDQDPVTSRGAQNRSVTLTDVEKM